MLYDKMVLRKYGTKLRTGLYAFLPEKQRKGCLHNHGMFTLSNHMCVQKRSWARILCASSRLHVR